MVWNRKTGYWTDWFASFCDYDDFFIVSKQDAEDQYERAKEILDVYENKKPKKEIYEQTTLNLDFTSQEESKIEKRLKEINPLEITPLEALNILDELKKYLKEK